MTKRKTKAQIEQKLAECRQMLEQQTERVELLRKTLERIDRYVIICEEDYDDLSEVISDVLYQTSLPIRPIKHRCVLTSNCND